MNDNDYRYISDYDASVINGISMLCKKIRDVSKGLSQFMDLLNANKASAIKDVSVRLGLAGNNTKLITAVFNSSSADASNNAENTYLNSCFSELTACSRHMADLLNGYYTNLKSRNDVSDISAYTDELEGVLDDISSVSANINTAASVISSSSTITDTSAATQLSADASSNNYMEYDPQTGLKKYMTDLLSLLDDSEIKYNMVAGRRYAIDVSGNRTEGDAFVRKSGIDGYKTLDSDGNIYWFSNNSSRHYYGEAVDIVPEGTTYSELLESLCDNDNIMDVMHQFGLSVHLENLEAGAGKGEHLCISTLGGDTASTWWKTANQIRTEHGLTTYTAILQSCYMSEEIKNTVVNYP
mgnify:CR=1 FL=1